MGYMRIAIFTDTYKPEINGIVTSVIQFSDILADEGHEILIFCPKYKKNDFDPRHKNITIKRCYSVNFVNYKDVRLAMPSLISVINDLKKFKPDIVHIQTPMILGIISLLAVKILKLRSILTYHSYIPDFMIYLKPKTLPGVKNFMGQMKGGRSVKKVLRSEIVEDKSKKYFRLKLVDKVGDLSEEVSKGDRQTSDKIAWELTRKLYNRGNLVLTPSSALKRELKMNGVRTRVEVLSNGIDLDYFKEKDSYEPTKKLIIAGRVGFEKNIDIVVKAVNLAAKKIPDLRLDIIGDGPATKDLKTLVQDLGCRKNVRFLGFIPREDLRNIYCKYDAFITASTMETQGLVILEAMSAGLPALGVNKLAVPDLIEHGINGYISKPFDEKEMANHIIKLYKDPERLKAFGEKSIELAKKHDVKKCSKKLIKFYEEISKRRIHAGTEAVKIK